MKPVYALLCRVQKGLNMIITAGRAATVLAWTGAAAGPVMLLLRLAGYRPPFFRCWLLVIITGLLAGWWSGRRKGITLAGAACWLDHSLQLQEVLSAALFCLERGCTGPFDRRIVTRAGKIACRVRNIRWPLGYLCRRVPAAAVVVLLVPVIINLELSVFRRQSPQPPLFLPAQEGGSYANRPEQQEPVLPEELADLLFSHDPELAHRAEYALREGDMAALAALLREAGGKMEYPAWEVMARELEQFLAAGGRLFPAGDVVMQEVPGARKGDTGFSGEKTSARSGANREQAGEEDRGGGSADSQTGAGFPAGDDAYAQDRQGESEPVPGGGTGANGSRGEGDAGGVTGGLGTAQGREEERVPPRTGQAEAVIKRPADSPVLEYVLPERDPRTPLSEALPPAARAAEEALARERAPLEYEQFIRDYFQELAREFD